MLAYAFVLFAIVSYYAGGAIVAAQLLERADPDDRASRWSAGAGRRSGPRSCCSRPCRGRWLERNGLHFENSSCPSGGPCTGSSSIASLSSTLIMLAGLVYERTKDVALHTLESANAELARARDEAERASAREERLPRDADARDPHADDGDPRLRRRPARRVERARRSPHARARRPGDDPAQRPRAARDDQRPARPVEDRGGQARARAHRVLARRAGGRGARAAARARAARARALARARLRPPLPAVAQATPRGCARCAATWWRTRSRSRSAAASACRSGSRTRRAATASTCACATPGSGIAARAARAALRAGVPLVGRRRRASAVGPRARDVPATHRAAWTARSRRRASRARAARSACWSRSRARARRGAPGAAHAPSARSRGR